MPSNQAGGEVGLTDLPSSPQASHATLRSDIDQATEPRPCQLTIQGARSNAELVSMRAALMQDHLTGMLEHMDSAQASAEPHN